MLELVEGMSEEELREVLEDEGVASIPSGVEEQRDLLRMLTNCNYLEYTYLDAASEQHTASLAQLRQLEDEGDITMETLIWAVRLSLCSLPLPFRRSNAPPPCSIPLADPPWRARAGGDRG